MTTELTTKREDDEWERELRSIRFQAYIETMQRIPELSPPARQRIWDRLLNLRR